MGALFMKKKNVIVIFALLLVGIVGFLGFNKKNTLEEDVTLRNSIIVEVLTSKEIDFSSITDFQWDTMYVFTPYSNPKSILKEDGIATANKSFSIEVLDNINMIGFVKSDNLVAFVELPRYYVVDDLNMDTKIAKEEAKFNIIQDKKVIDFKKIQK
jgi:hypothetical protein